MDYSPLKISVFILLFVWMPEKLSKIELYLIEKVKEARKSRNISQEELSLRLGKGVGFIGDIEAPSKTAKYNVKHLNDIAKIFDCSPREFWPDKAL